MLIGMSSIKVLSRQYCHRMFDIFMLIIEIIRVKYIRLEIRWTSQTSYKYEYGQIWDVTIAGLKFTLISKVGNWLSHPGRVSGYTSDL